MIPILYDHPEFLVVDKPAGLLVHRTQIAADARGSLMHELRDQIGHWVYPIHRLDRAASGVMVLGKTSEAASKLGELFAQRDIHKTYWAVVRGFTAESGVIDTPLRKIQDDGTPSNDPPQEALTRYRRLGTCELPIPVGKLPSARYSLVEVEIETGRLHQIRRHMHRSTHPLIGDTAYGEGKHNRLWREQFGLHRMLLFSRRLSFNWGTATISVAGPLPADVAEVFARWNWPTQT